MDTLVRSLSSLNETRTPHIFVIVGTQPYWDWSKTAITGLTKSPIFDGSETSTSGNGEHIPGNELGRLNLGGPEGTDLPPLYLPTGYGGGCIKSGPFKDSKPLRFETA